MSHVSPILDSYTLNQQNSDKSEYGAVPEWVLEPTILEDQTAIDDGLIFRLAEAEAKMSCGGGQSLLEAAHLQTLIEKLLGCARRAWHRGLYDDDRRRNCKHKLCVYCSNAARHEQRARIYSAVDWMEPPAFCTLTMPNTFSSLTDALKQLKDVEKSFWRRCNFRGLTASGLRAVDVKVAPETRQWNVHLHCVLELPADKFAELDQCWKKSGGGFTNLVRPSKRFAAANYCLKVNLAGLGITEKDHSGAYRFNPVLDDPIAFADLLKQFRNGLRRKRLHSTFGEARRRSFEHSKPDKEVFTREMDALIARRPDQDKPYDDTFSVLGHVFRDPEIVEVTPNRKQIAGAWITRPHTFNGIKVMPMGRMKRVWLFDGLKGGYSDPYPERQLVIGSYIWFKSDGTPIRVKCDYWDHVPRHTFDSDESELLKLA